jgi:hypothetical protein
LKEKIKNATGIEVLKHQENIAGVICAEQLVVGVGVIFALRILSGHF